jgi:hypothetical protein
MRRGLVIVALRLVWEVGWEVPPTDYCQWVVFPLSALVCRNFVPVANAMFLHDDIES